MSKWIIKAVGQRAIGFLPYRYFWYELFQCHLTGSLTWNNENFEFHLGRAAKHLEYLFENVELEKGEEFTGLELGTGWYPVLPVAMYLSGASHIWTYDIASFLTRERVEKVIHSFLEYHARGELEKFIPWVSIERVERLREIGSVGNLSPSQVLSRLNIHVKVQDACQTGLAAHSIDLIASTSVLEYVPESVLEEMLIEFQRIASPRAIMTHRIYLADQYSCFDSSITPFNFLKFSDFTWSIINNPFTPLTRLRHNDFRSVLKTGGFEIVSEEVTKGSLEQLRSVSLAKKFQDTSEEDLLVLYSWIVAKPSNSPSERPTNLANLVPVR